MYVKYYADREKSLFKVKQLRLLHNWNNLHKKVNKFSSCKVIHHAKAAWQCTYLYRDIKYRYLHNHCRGESSFWKELSGEKKKLQTKGIKPTKKRRDVSPWRKADRGKNNQTAGQNYGMRCPRPCSLAELILLSLPIHPLTHTHKAAKLSARRTPEQCRALLPGHWNVQHTCMVCGGVLLVCWTLCLL